MPVVYANLMDSAGGKRARTRARLIDAAFEVVMEKGFASASLDEIAARAGMTKGAIYSNFADKADLMFQAAMRGALKTEPAYDPGVPLKAQFRELGRSVLALLPRARGRERVQAEFQLYVASEPEVARRMAGMQTRFFDEMTQLLERGYGEELAVPARSLVLAAQALSTGFVHQYLVTPEEVTEPAVIAAFEALAEGALRGKKES